MNCDITFNVSTLDSLHDAPLILYSENGDITIRSSTNTIHGILYAPNGTVQIHTSSFELEGRIIADRITMNGSNFEFYELSDGLGLLNGFSQFMACSDHYNELVREVPFNDYNTPSNNPTMHEIRELLLKASASASEDMVQSVVLCYAALDKVKELRDELVQEQFLLEQIAADPFGDYDGDGLLNGFELEMLSNYTNPLLYDTDGDGIPDGEEDPDQDGLSNLMEQELGTDPLSADTDGDGLKDGSEVRLGTDPLSVDTNGNGLIDSEEIYTQTIQGPVPNVKLEVTAIGDISEAVYIFDATSNIVADQNYSVTDSVYSVSGLYEFRSELPFERARIHLPVDLDKLGDREIEHVKMVYFDEELMTFIPLEKQGVDPATGTVWGETDHFSLYTLFYLPNLGAIWQVPFISGDRESNTEIIFLDVMFVIDSSGSMDWNDPNDYRKTAAKNFVDGLIPGTRVGVATGDRAGVVDFDSYATLTQSLTDDFERVKAAIDRIDASGGTNIGAGVNAANNELIRNSSDDRIKIQILLTDGDGSYSHSYTTNAFENGIVIYTIGLGSGINENLLKEIAGRTGGQYFHASGAEDLPIVFDRIRDIVNEQEDTDGDGIPDIVEIQGMRVGLFYDKLIYTDPYNPDTDGDGLLDGEEIGEAIEINILGHTHRYYPMYSNPTMYDTDGDGVSDYDERRIYGIDPFSVDTDYDGLSDGFEVNYVPPSATQQNDLITNHTFDIDIEKLFIKPWLFDSDGDGISDWDEIFGEHLEPKRPDTIIKGMEEYRIKSNVELSGRVHVYSPIVVEKSGTLNILPGTEIFSYIPENKPTIQVYGKLNIGSREATSDIDKVSFKYVQLEENKYWKYWSGIIAYDGAELNIVNTFIHHAKHGLWLNGGVTANIHKSAISSNHDASIIIPQFSYNGLKYYNEPRLVVTETGFYDRILVDNAVYASIYDSFFDNTSLYIVPPNEGVDIGVYRSEFKNSYGDSEAAVYLNEYGKAYPYLELIDTKIGQSKIGLQTTGGNVYASIIGGGFYHNDVAIHAGDFGEIDVDVSVEFIGNGTNINIAKAGWKTPYFVAKGIVLEISGDIIHLIPDMFEFAGAIARGEVTFETLKAALGNLWDSYEDSFNNLKNNYSRVLSGQATKSEAEQYGRDLALVIEVISVAKAATNIGYKGLKGIVDDVDNLKRRAIPCNCFVAGTLVLTEEGEKPIEEIEVGDKVLSKSDLTGEVAYKEVTTLFQRQAEEIYSIYVGDEIIEVTGEHPFWLHDKGWTLVQDLQVGDLLVSSDGTILVIDQIEKELRQETVYNFEVKDYSSYFVSKDGVWVHNSDECAVPVPKNRNGLRRAMGEKPYDNALAHHGLPWKYREWFAKRGLDVNDPQFGSWVRGLQFILAKKILIRETLSRSFNQKNRSRYMATVLSISMSGAALKKRQGSLAGIRRLFFYPYIASRINSTTALITLYKKMMQLIPNVI